ncbi:MAG: hypothetical protein HW421_3504 [Ignavibacteria bacterium]|nr:hypothetical protein [Ignavibacteria bacterium]
MKRRDFIYTSITAAGAVFASNNLLAADNSKIDLVAVKGAMPDVMLDKAMETLGGMKNFVKKGQTVVIKPNIGWDVAPERAGNTNPKLVSQIIRHCLAAGAKKVFIFDNTCDNWQKCYSTSGIERAAKDAGATVVSGANEGMYHNVSIAKGKKLTTAKVHELILQSDVFINVPVLKNHGSARVTATMKNLMGIVWDRRFWHKNDLHQCIAEFASYRKPTLNIIDAYNVMVKNGPRGVSTDDVAEYKSLIVSTDMVAADTAASKLIGLNPDDVQYIGIAASLNVGRKNLEQLNIKRIKM